MRLRRIKGPALLLSFSARYSCFLRGGELLEALHHISITRYSPRFQSSCGSGHVVLLLILLSKMSSDVVHLLPVRMSVCTDDERGGDEGGPIEGSKGGGEEENDRRMGGERNTSKGSLVIEGVLECDRKQGPCYEE